MKQQLIKLKKLSYVTLLTALITLMTAHSAFAADNTGTGDIGGAALTDSNTFTINVYTGQIVKTAFLTDGTALTSGTTLPQGTTVRFVIYIVNTTPVAINDYSLSDVLTGFTYVNNTIKLSLTETCAAATCTGGELSTIYTNLNGSGALDDGLNATDQAGYNGSNTVSVGDNTGNNPVNVAAGDTLVVMFDATLN